MAPKKANTLIIGMGEIGSALYSILSECYDVWGLDTKKELCKMAGAPKRFDLVHICIRYSRDFDKICNGYINRFDPEYLDVCSTVPIGTTKRIFGRDAVHSTTRGLHPNLIDGLKSIEKHIGGGEAEFFKDYFECAGISCTTHRLSQTTEACHLINNIHYALNICFAEEASQIFRSYGVDFFDYLQYTKTNNEGFIELGHPTKVRTIATPPGSKLGGHCVVPSAQLIPEKKRGFLTNFVAHFNDDKKSG